MLSFQILAFAFAIAPSLVSAALFPPDSLVKVIDAKGFKKAMKKNDTSMVAFVAPWCGHCQNMAPEYSKAALGLYPLIPTYAVNCDAEKNKQLCAEQGVTGFPTIKLFPRGNILPPLDYVSDRTSSGFYYFAKGGIPKVVKMLVYDYEFEPWIEKHKSKPRALLLKKGKKTPLLWTVLANKYAGQVEFGTRLDRKGKMSVEMGLEAGDKTVSKVLLYPAGSTKFIVYEGIQKHDSLSKFLDSVLSGTADLSAVLEELKTEELVIDDKELEIERKQEAQKIALMHGGFGSLIDFEQAIKDTAGRNFHGSHGYEGIMGGIPEHLKKKPSDAPSLETEGETTTPYSTQKEDEAEPIVEDKTGLVEEEQILDQVVLEAAKNLDTEASPEGCQDASSQAGQGVCSTERPKDEL